METTKQVKKQIKRYVIKIALIEIDNNDFPINETGVIYSVYSFEEDGYESTIDMVMKEMEETANDLIEMNLDNNRLETYPSSR